MKHERILRKIAKFIMTAEGKENAINSAKIAEAIGFPPGSSREVRRIIAGNIDWFWDRDICLLATAGRGYYIGNDAEQFQNYRDYLTALGLTVTAKSQALSRLCKRQGITLK